MSAIDVYVYQTFNAQNISLVLLQNVSLSCVLCTAIFFYCRVTLITGRLQKINHINLSKT